MIPYNSILNESWYNRLRRKVGEEANTAIRSTGSRVDDPFWMARQQEGLSDLNSQRLDAFAQLREQSLASAANYQNQEAARQRRISMALADRVKPDTYLTANAEQPEQPGETPASQGLQEVLPVTPLPAPNTPREQRSAGAYMPYKPYNPAKFFNPLIERRKKWLLQYQNGLTKIPVY